MPRLIVFTSLPFNVWIQKFSVSQILKISVMTKPNCSFSQLMISFCEDSTQVVSFLGLSRFLFTVLLHHSFNGAKLKFCALRHY